MRVTSGAKTTDVISFGPIQYFEYIGPLARSLVHRIADITLRASALTSTSSTSILSRGRSSMFVIGNRRPPFHSSVWNHTLVSRHSQSRQSSTACSFACSFVYRSLFMSFLDETRPVSSFFFFFGAEIASPWHRTFSTDSNH